MAYGSVNVPGKIEDLVGFGTPTATVDANVGTPSVTVTASGPDKAKVFNFSFKNLKGATGATGAKGATGPQGATGKTAYQYAVDGGYTGTEAEFQTLMGTGPWVPETRINSSSLALGPNAKSNGESSVALGPYAKSNGSYSVALGPSANVTSISGIAIGYDSRVRGEGSIGIGSGLNIYFGDGIAIGGGIRNSGERSIAIGPGIIIESVNGCSTAIGDEAKINGSYSTAIGCETNVTGNYSTVLGCKAATSNANSIQLGSATTLASLTCLKSLTVTSDERDKTDIHNLSNATEFLRKLRAFSYVRNDRELYNKPDEELTEAEQEIAEKYGFRPYDKEAHAAGTLKRTRHRVGVSAQEVRQALIDAYGSDDFADIVNDNLHDFPPEEIPEGVESHLGVTYEKFIPFLIRGFQELDTRITALEVQNA